MTVIKTQINRRSFLKVSAATGGGMMLGFSWLASCSPEEQKAALKSPPKEWFDINAFIKIGDNGSITIFSPNPEIGQNVKTSMPLIVAEELDVDWKDVTVQQADLNTVKYKRQLAGGSQSIRQGWQSLRMAGATARKMLMQAAAKEWQADIAQLSTEKGRVLFGSKSLGYGELAQKAALVKIPEEVTLKDREDFKLIGTRVKNVDAPKIVKGEPLFGLDYKEEGMLTAMIVHPPAFGMKLKSVDDSAAKLMSGIRDVVVIKSAPENRQWSDVNAFPELVAVVGESTWQVLKAKRSLAIEWENESPLENSAGHNDQLIAALEGKADTMRKDGNPESAFANADRIIERTYSAPFLGHNPMEPMNFFANVTNEKAELIGPIQTPEFLRKSASDLLGLNEDQISVKMTRMGGGFGRRLYGHFGLEAAAISQQVKAPIKLVYTREDDMTQGTYRPAYRVKYRAALDKDNQLLAMHIKGAGLPGSPLFPNRYPAGTLDNFLIEGAAVGTNVSTGAWRAPRSNFIAGAEQSFLDELAEEMGEDPIDLRLSLFDRAINNPVGENNNYDAKRYAGVLKLVKEKSNWGEKKEGIHRGVSAYFCHNSYVAQVLDMEKQGDELVIKKVWCAVDCGIVVNLEGAENQIEGGIIDGIGHALYSQLSFHDGKPQQENFNSYRLIRHTEAPIEIETFFVDNGIDPTGLGEPSLPPISAALANAMYKATGQRYYHQPFATAEQGIQIKAI